MEKEMIDTVQNINTPDYSILLNTLIELRDKSRLNEMKLSYPRLPNGERDRTKMKQKSIEQQIHNLIITYKNAPLPCREYYAERQELSEHIDSWIEAITKS